MSRLIAKVVFGGDGGVGKTTLIQRYLTGEFIDTTKLTIGVGFHLHQMSYQEHEISLSVWDLGGQEQFKQMGIFDNYFRGALVAVLMFDLTRSSTIKGLESWAGFVDKESNTSLILVGGKSDLPRDSLIDDDMIAARTSNLYFGTGLLNDTNTVKVLDMADLDASNNVRMVMRFTSSVQFGVASDIVTYA